MQGPELPLVEHAFCESQVESAAATHQPSRDREQPTPQHRGVVHLPHFGERLGSEAFVGSGLSFPERLYGQRSAQTPKTCVLGAEAA